MIEWTAQKVAEAMERHNIKPSERACGIIADLLNQQLPPSEIPFKEEAKVIWNPGWPK